MEVLNMAKCEKCGKEYPDGTEHVCSLQEEQKQEESASQEEKNTPADEDKPQEEEKTEKTQE